MISATSLVYVCADRTSGNRAANAAVMYFIIILLGTITI
jgi:hypothetical protein